MSGSYNSHKPTGHVPEKEVIRETKKHVGPGKVRSTDRLVTKQHEGQSIHRSLKSEDSMYLDMPEEWKLTPEQIASYKARFPQKEGDLEELEMPLFINNLAPDPKKDLGPVAVEKEVRLLRSKETISSVPELEALDSHEVESHQNSNGHAEPVTVREKFNTKPKKSTEQNKRPPKVIIILMILRMSTAFVLTAWLMLVFGTWIGTLVFIPFIGLAMSIGLLFGSIGIFSMSLSPAAAEREKYLWAGGILLSMGSMGLVVSLLYAAPVVWSKFFILF